MRRGRDQRIDEVDVVIAVKRQRPPHRRRLGHHAAVIEQAEELGGGIGAGDFVDAGQHVYAFREDRGGDVGGCLAFTDRFEERAGALKMPPLPAEQQGDDRIRVNDACAFLGQRSPKPCRGRRETKRACALLRSERGFRRRH